MSVFPPIPLAEWADTKETLHRFLQVVGKLRLANAPRRNHWWHVPFHLTGRGLTTRPMGFDPVFAVDLDLVDHRLEVSVADGRRASFPLPGLSVAAFYRQLRREGKGDEKYLEVYWYTGKDMTRPLNAVRKQRNCHVKFAAFDGQVAVLGSGNQDTQSWFHSQEINVMVDSKQIVDEWMAALGRNQSTKLYGMVDQRDGIWRGRDGKELVDTGKDKASESEKRERSSSPPASTSGAVSATTATTATVVSK